MCPCEQARERPQDMPLSHPWFQALLHILLQTLLFQGHKHLRPLSPTKRTVALWPIAWPLRTFSWAAVSAGQAFAPCTGWVDFQGRCSDIPYVDIARTENPIPTEKPFTYFLTIAFLCSVLTFLTKPSQAKFDALSFQNQVPTWLLPSGFSLKQRKLLPFCIPSTLGEPRVLLKPDVCTLHENCSINARASPQHAGHLLFWDNCHLESGNFLVVCLFLDKGEENWIRSRHPLPHPPAAQQTR